MARILVIDDNLLSLESMKIALEANGHTVSATSDGNEGLQWIDQQPFDLLITDLIMPEKEGVEILLEVKRDHSDVKVIVVSGGGRNKPEGYLKSAQSLGADEVLAKPFSASELTQSVNHVLG